ncbi:MAG: rhamnogalacturonan acetylesterase [Chitinispirillaceae bacterium]|nr:rhamnogalacturonan acetylesterase [Chitinispirillaceae bacterium]
MITGGNTANRYYCKLHSTPFPSTVLLFGVTVFAVTVNAQNYKYDFGSGATATGYTNVTPNTIYSSAQGYGFEPGATVTAVDRGGEDFLRGDYCTGTTEFMFSVKVPQGAYDLTVIVGDASATSITTVTAENRRLLFDRIATASGRFASKTITIDRREVKSLDGKVTMSIKEREQSYYTWDDKVTLRFGGPKPCVCGIEHSQADNAITIYLCGNSTVVDQLDTPWCSWGQMITRFFKPGVCVANYAESGLSSGDFLAMKRLAKIMSDAKTGDYVFVEFGHNDQKSDAGITAYPTNLKTFRDQICAKNAIPIFVSPTARDGETDPLTSIGGLAETMRKTAASLNVPLIDLNMMTITLVKALGSKKNAVYQDVSHFKEYGGFELARCVAKGIYEFDNSLNPFLTDELPVFNPSVPDPVDYLVTLPSVSALRPGSSTSRALGMNTIVEMNTVELSINIRGNRIHYRTLRKGRAVFTVYAISGRSVAAGTLDLNRHEGSLVWRQLATLPPGIYLLQTRFNNLPCVKVRFCIH